MTAPLRVAFARINQETNALSPVPTTLHDFQATHWLQGAELLAACGRFAQEVKGFVRSAELSGFVRALGEHSRPVEAVPLFSAWAVASGPLTAGCFAALRDQLVAGLQQAGRLDGVYLCLHGAMGVQGLRDPEAELIEAARRVVGPVPVAVTYDLHANLSQRRVAGADFSVSYRTNPHRDHFAVGRRAGRLLLGQIEGKLRPTTAWRSLPLLLGGGTTLDFWRPMRAIFRRMTELERDPRVLSCSVNMCHPWNDDPELGWSVVVTTDDDPAQAERLADELAERCWQVRHEQPPRFASAAEAVQTAREARLARKLGAVVLADASDVVSAGATGENPRLLAEILRSARDLRAWVPLRDPVTVEHLWSLAPGATVDVELGGKLDPARNPPLSLRARLHDKRTAHGFGRMVVLAADEVRVIVTEGPALVMKPSFFQLAGLDPWRADVLVVKNFFPFRLYFLPLARKTVYVRTEGITDFDAAFQLQFTDAVHPRDPVADWRPADRRRRGVA